MTLSDPALAQEYDPTAGVADWRDHLAAWSRAAESARRSLPHRADLRYGAGPRQCLDIFPAAPGAAAVIFIHGGYWRALSKEFVAGVAATLVPAGLASVHVGYDLCPGVPLARIVAEIDEALAWCGDNLASHGVDPSRLVLAGSSAGAHLAACALAAVAEGRGGSAIRGAFLSSGLYDLEPLAELPVGAALGLDRRNARDLSPLHRPPPAGLPLVVQVGALESRSWRDQSRRYAAACQAAGAKVSFGEIPEAHHFAIGLGIPGTAASQALLAAALAWTAAP